MMRYFTHRYAVTVPDYRKEPATPPARGYISVRIGETEHQVELTIDLEAIVRMMGPKAVRSKSGKSVDGFVTVKHIRRKGA